MCVRQDGKLFLGQWSEDSLSFGFHVRHPTRVARHADDSRCEAKRDVLAFVEITFPVHVTPDLNGKLPISLRRDTPVQPLRKRVFKAVGPIPAKQTFAHWHRVYYFPQR